MLLGVRIEKKQHLDEGIMAIIEFIQKKIPTARFSLPVKVRRRVPFPGRTRSKRSRATPSSCGGAGACGPTHLGYAVLLLEHGVLCVLPMLWAALLFSEAGCDFWAGWTGAAAATPPPPPVEGEQEVESGDLWCSKTLEDDGTFVLFIS